MNNGENEVVMSDVTAVSDEKKVDSGSSYSAKEQKLIQQLVQVRLDKKSKLEYESLDDYVVPPRTHFSMLKKPAVSIKRGKMQFNMACIRLFEGIKHILPIISESKQRLAVLMCAEEEISSVEWARIKKNAWVNKPITSLEFVENIFNMMEWNTKCRYKVLGRIAQSQRGLIMLFDLSEAIMFDPVPEEYIDKQTGEVKKRTNGNVNKCAVEKDPKTRQHIFRFSEPEAKQHRRRRLALYRLSAKMLQSAFPTDRIKHIFEFPSPSAIISQHF